MDALQVEHPSPERLSDFGLGRLDEEASAVIETHLSHCASCRTVVEMLPNDTLLSLLQNPARPIAETVTSSESAPAAPSSTEIPADLANHPRYHVLELLGSGGMGAVYKAKHYFMERLVALKVMNPSLMKRPSTVERFEREVKAAARLTHPHIVTSHDADRAGETHFLVMEFVEGISLADKVQQHGPLPVIEACTYIYQAALGLQHAFECGMVHRDIKPHNLMLTPSISPSSQRGDKGGTIKILDFGLARLMREETAAATEEPRQADLRQQADDGPTKPVGPLTGAGTLMGTADFIAPEQAADPRRADIRADIYSLGCTLYYLLAGHAPFPDGSALDKLAAHRERMPMPLDKLRRDLPAGLAEVIDRMLAKEPAQRYQTPADVAQALAPFAGKVFWSRRRIRHYLAAAACFAAVLLAGIFIYVQTDKGELVIEADNDKVAVIVNDKGVKIRDLAANRDYQLTIGPHRIRPGQYMIDVQELPDGVKVPTPSFTLQRGGKTAVTVTYDPRRDPGYLKNEALRWFPKDAVFFTVGNLEIFPGVSHLHKLLWMEKDDLGSYWAKQKEDRFRRFVDLIGRLDRVAIAYTNDRQSPEQSRYFNRFTGAISHSRLVDFFRQEWPGATIEQTLSQGVPITLIHDAPPKGILGTAVALIGSTDLILAGYGGRAMNHIEVVRECLALREGRGENLPAAYAKALAEIPADSWVFGMSETPAFLKKQMPWFLRLARTITMSVSGTSDIKIRFRGTFSSEADVKLFLTYLNLLKQLFLNAPAVINNADLSASVTEACNSLRVESEADHVTAQVHIPSIAAAALLEKLQDIPIRMYLDPVKEK